MVTKSCLYAIESLRFKLQMFGIPFGGPTHACCNNESAVRINPGTVESTLEKAQLYCILLYQK